ncbi:8-oxoguanine DNA glycosylase OGG fold protein [Jiangella rhizosphaerae]|uniref:Uncharacterized protein n=1 Tax=Jiangella rhizosphaerae TaxID=2293569 RepID=A0A418KVA4_9ACTN|nr:hypothetical protein [Jiangella rhizosphaerae]RIQ31205.1 hypothetical protein DY240_06510 [Jiangella rhizosphaerae]
MSTSPPPVLRDLLDRYADVREQPVRLRPSTWQNALIRVPESLGVTALLTSRSFTIAVPGSKTHDRMVGRDGVRAACAAMNVDDTKEVLRTFVLAMAWASGLTGGRYQANTAKAILDPARAFRVLSDAAKALRHAGSMRDGALEEVHRWWSLPGVGQSYASKWWALAGRTEGRDWQPLVLDDRVYATLNDTLRIGGTARLAGSRRRADRYRAYVETVHRWAVELQLAGHDVDAERIEFVLFHHNGGAPPGR